MPQISAFRGLRYDLGHVGSLQEVVANSHLLGTATHQRQLYERHPANVVRLVANRIEPGDNDGAKYGRAARFFKNWQQEGVLQREPDPAIYVYHQVFEYEGSSYTRRSFICRMKLEESSAQDVILAEELDDAEHQDRLRLLEACQANLRPILAHYKDEQDVAQSILEQAILNVAPIEAHDAGGVCHRLWPVSDIRLINDLTSAMADRQLCIGQGVADYQAAITYRQDGGQPSNRAFDTGSDHVMMMLTRDNDPGFTLVPHHKLYHGVPSLTSDALKNQLSPFFDVRIAGEGSDLAEMIWDQIEIEQDPGLLGLYCHLDERWLVAKLNEQGKEHLAQKTGFSEAQLPTVSSYILEHLVIGPLVGDIDGPAAKVVHRISDLVDAIDNGNVDEDAAPFELVAMTLPTAPDKLRTIAKRGIALPSNQIDNYPNTLCGLTFHSHNV